MQDRDARFRWEGLVQMLSMNGPRVLDKRLGDSIVSENSFFSVEFVKIQELSMAAVFAAVVVVLPLVLLCQNFVNDSSVNISKPELPALKSVS